MSRPGAMRPPAFAVPIFEYSVNSIKKSLTTRHRGGDPEVPLNAFITGAGVFTITLILQLLWGVYLTRTLPPEDSGQS